MKFQCHLNRRSVATYSKGDWLKEQNVVVLSKSPLRGVVRGKVIELSQDTGLPDGQEVTITLQPTPSQSDLPPGEGLRQSFGAWAEDGEDLDKYLEWNRQQRKIDRRPLEP